jgi:hypothetical protein
VAIFGAVSCLQVTAAVVLAAAPAERTTVRVVVAGEAEQQQAMSVLLAEFFPDAQFELKLSNEDAINPIDVVEPPPSATGAAARIWLELGHPERAVVYVTDAEWERVLIRRLDFETLDAVAREEIAYVVDSSVRAILAGGQIGIAREDAARELGIAQPQPNDATGPRPAERQPPTWSVTFGYRLRAWDKRSLQHGPRLGISAWAVHPKVWAGASLVGRGYLPTTFDSGNLRLELVGGHLGGRSVLLFPVHPNVAIAVEPGIGLDLIRDTTTVLEAPGEAFPSNLRALPTVSLDAGTDFFVGKKQNRLRIGVRALLDVDLLGIRYVTADTATVLFEPWRFRPGAAVSIGWMRRAIGS